MLQVVDATYSRMLISQNILLWYFLWYFLSMHQTFQTCWILWPENWYSCKLIMIECNCSLNNVSDIPFTSSLLVSWVPQLEYFSWKEKEDFHLDVRSWEKDNECVSFLNSLLKCYMCRNLVIMFSWQHKLNLVTLWSQLVSSSILWVVIHGSSRM